MLNDYETLYNDGKLSSSNVENSVPEMIETQFKIKHPVPKAIKLSFSGNCSA